MLPLSRRSALLRGAGFVLAAALGIIGVWLIVTGSDSKTVRVGAISAFWGLLLGTYAMFGARLPTARNASEPTAVPAPPARELDLREVGELERAAVAAARHEFQQELQAVLRREVVEGFAREVADLRADVGSLRSELVEKVGGQLRLERIETTRLIGSDLEALQSELRKLRQTNVEGDAAAPSLPAAISLAQPSVVPSSVVQPSAGQSSVGQSSGVQASGVQASGVQASGVQASGGQSSAVPSSAVRAPVARPAAPEPPQRPAQPEPEIHDAEIVAEIRHAPGPQQRPAQAAPTPPPPRAPHVAPSVPSAPSAPPKPPTPPTRDPEPELSDDPFAGMPRITPFTEFPLDPIPPAATEPPSSRRHRADDGGNEVLARILARENR